MKTWALVFFIFPLSLFAQKFVIKESLDMTVMGTSTLHDWEMVSEKGIGEAVIIMDNGLLADIESLSFQIKTETLKSGKNTMDGICYDAMKTSKYPNIEFLLNDISRITRDGDKYKITASGNLTIAGTTKYQTMTVHADFSKDKIVFTGLHTVKMTDFNVDPPTAMFGTIKTGNDLEIKFEVVYENEDGLSLMRIP